MRVVQILVLMVVFQILMAADAQAYLDPGTGSFIFQTVIAMVVGAGFTLKLYWQRIKQVFTRKSAASEAASEKEDGAAD